MADIWASPAGPTGRSLAVRGAYPAVMAIGFGLYAASAPLLGSPALASYLAVAVAALLITLHEIALPYRRSWRPSAAELRVDALFLILIQVALPYLLAVTLVVALSALARENGLVIRALWPHEAPVAAQTVLMLLAADFVRYWMHRGFHKVRPLWRLHAVHHSPHRLYWVNVGRFHPVEKAIQYCADALPFALAGVAPEVLAAYFVFYGINGFYQHSNCLVRLGWLNYLVSGPELHRWHHSRLPQESDSNFGNNLIVWDILFGTRFLPSGREVGSLGLVNRDYPMGFVDQMKSPFVAGLEEG